MTIIRHLLICLSLFYSLNVADDHSCKLSVFVWDTEILSQTVIDTLESDGVCRLYIYCSVKNTDGFEDALRLCEDNDIDVYALNGSYEWIDKPEKLTEFFEVVRSIKADDYKNFKGVVLDIEPYVADNFSDGDYEILMDLIEEGQDLSEALRLKQNIVVPFWYEKVAIERDQLSHLANWIIFNSDETTIMAYRNTLHGKNGILDLIDEELLINAIANKKLNIALETRPSKEGDNISFSEQDRSSVLSTIEDLKKILVFKWRDVNYVIHDLESWLNLK